MTEWLHDAFEMDQHISVALLVTRLTAALLLGCVVALIYRLTHGESDGQSTALMATLVLLTVLISMVTLVIGDNQARAFSLVGALAIIRFRTVVEDTRDTAFVICAVAVGMSIGSGFLTVPVIGLPFAAAAAFLFRPKRGSSEKLSADWTLMVRVGIGKDPAVLEQALHKHLESRDTTGTSTSRQGAALDLSYRVRLQAATTPLALVAELNQIEGVQQVELQRV